MRQRLFYIVLILVVHICTTKAVFANEGRFLLLLGPSGVGKSTVIHELKKIDPRYEYITPLTTRPLRPGETDKIHVTIEQIRNLEQSGKLLTVNYIYGIYYATPKVLIDDALSKGNYPVLDWPAEKMPIMKEYYSKNLYVVYLYVDNLEELQRRLSLDNRDKDSRRFEAAKNELQAFFSGKYDAYVDDKIASENGKSAEIARKIHNTIIRLKHIQTMKRS